MNNLPPKPSWMSDADYREHAERRARLDAAEWLSPDDVAKDWDVPQPEERPNGHAAPSKGAGAANSEAPDPRKIAFTPYAWRAPETLPMRRWVYGRHYIRKYLSTTIAAGGLGKSSLDLVEAVAMVAGINLLGVPVHDRLRVAYWGEDPKDEIDRRVGS
jgi:AAA domain